MEGKGRERGRGRLRERERGRVERKGKGKGRKSIDDDITAAGTRGNVITKARRGEGRRG